MDHIRNELGHGGSQDRKRGLGMQNNCENVMRFLSSAPYPTFLSLNFDLGYLGDFTSCIYSLLMGARHCSVG